METTKLKIGITSTAVLLSSVGVLYALWKRKCRLLDSAEAFKYLSIQTITTEDACDRIVEELMRKCELHRAVGFDCEWVTMNGKRQPVALIQLSSFDGLCGLFRLSMMKTIPDSLKQLLEDETIYKVGVAPGDDAKYLCQDYGVNLNSSLDVRHIADVCGYHAGGLASLSKTLLHVILDKSWRIRCSKWDAETLTDRQVIYAAADAHVGVRIFVNLIEELSNRSIMSWLFRSREEDVWSKVNELCWKYRDISFRTKTISQKTTNELKQQKERGNKKQEVLSKRYPHTTRTRPLYHNCFLEAPDGEMLCTCDTKKAQWYVEKELADVVNEQPLTVRLRFEPAGRAVGDVGLYYKLVKENKCVVCGDDGSYNRKNVVPKEYRKHFPDIMKDHSSHDVVLLCTSCHQRSNIRDQAMRERLADMCTAPLPTHNNSRYTENANCRKVRSAARALLYSSRQLPDARRKVLEDVLLENYPQHDEITQELLDNAAEVQLLMENLDYESHGFRVVEYFLKHEGGLLRLEQIWREHFLISMQPKFMPELWSVKHNEERLQVKLNEGRLSKEDIKLIGLSRWL